MTRKNEQPFMKKRTALSPETNLPSSKKGCSFFSPPPEWLERVAVWISSAMQVPRKCHDKMSAIAQSISAFHYSSCQVSRLIIVFCNTNSITY